MADEKKCVAMVGAGEVWSRHSAPCGKPAKGEHDGAPLCGTHLRKLKMDRRLTVAKQYSGGELRIGKPSDAKTRYSVGIWREGSPHLDAHDWSNGNSWEKANPDELAVRREYVEALRKYHAKLSEKVNRISGEIDAEMEKIRVLEV
ncbi:MAG: hypothetical protein WC683_01305 [bacterium]